MCVHNLPYFFEKGESEEIQATQKYHCSPFNIKHIQSLMTLCSKCLYYDFHILIISSKSFRCPKKHIYIMYLMKMEELSPLSFNAFTLITDTRTP